MQRFPVIPAIPVLGSAGAISKFVIEQGGRAAADTDHRIFWRQERTMERLLLLDSENYTDDMPEIVRIAVRGIIIQPEAI